MLMNHNYTFYSNKYCKFQFNELQVFKIHYEVQVHIRPALRIII